MNKTVLVTGIALAISALSVTGYAEEGFYEEEDSAVINDLKEGMTFGAATVIGGLLAGPVGAMIGGVSGTLLGPELTKADKYELTQQNLTETETELFASQKKIANLQEQLQTARVEHQHLQQLALTNLEFQVLFHTGNDSLDGYSAQRLDELAGFLARNPELSVRLHGHADPRGTEEYNNVLSMHRTINVQQALEMRGIDASRIERRFYGSDQSRATKGDLDAYALERRVSIEVFDRNKGVASIEDQ